MTASATIHVEPEPEPELPVLLELLRTQLQAIADEAGDDRTLRGHHHRR
jgi:hypothetical protein